MSSLRFSWTTTTTIILCCLVILSTHHHLLPNHNENIFTSVTAQNSTSNSTYYIPSEFANAVDAGVNEMLSDTEFVQGSNQYNFFFPVPTCAKLPYSGNVIPSWPNKLVLPRGENSKLVLCYEVDALLNWPLVHELAGNVLMRIINTHYKLSIPYQFNKVNTSKLGYFTTMKNLVDTGACDIAIASTNLDSNRLPQVHFNCPYGTSSPGYLRSALDLSNITISKPEDINNPNVTIVTYGGSFYATYAKNNFPLAKLIGLTSGYTECFTYILEKKAHIMLGDAIDLQTWVKQRSSECPGCESKVFGDTFNYGSFITNNIRASESVKLNHGMTWLLVMVLVVMTLGIY